MGVYPFVDGCCKWEIIEHESLGKGLPFRFGGVTIMDGIHIETEVTAVDICGWVCHIVVEELLL